jgi:hypothetical protein
MVHILALGIIFFVAIFLPKCEINFGIAIAQIFFFGIYDFFGLGVHNIKCIMEK